MKTVKYLLYSSLAALFCLSAFSCAETVPAYVPGEPATGAQAYFSTELPTDFDLDETGVITIPVKRFVTDAAVEVGLSAVCDPAFTVPATVAFAAGQAEATFDITYNLDNLVRGNFYDFVISLTAEATPYANGVYHCIALLSPWESLGIGEWFDNLALMSSSSYGVQEVEVLHNSVIPNTYRIMGPYANTDQLAAAWGEGNVLGPKAEYIEWWIKEDGVHVAWDQFWYCGVCYNEGDPSTPIKAYYPSARTGKADANDDLSQIWQYAVSEGFDLVEFQPYWYIDGLGGFGCYPCYLTMPGGPAMADILG